MLSRQYIVSIVTIIINSNLLRPIDCGTKLIPESENIFEKCEGHEGTNGVYDVLDMSELILTYAEDAVNVEGNATFIWDVEPNDRVEVRADLYKNFRNHWQMTPFSIKFGDLCEQMLTPGNHIYNIWSQYIYKEDLKCPIKNARYRHHPIVGKLEFPDNWRIFGQHKITVQLVKLSENGEKQHVYCVEMPVDVISF